jgi:hypothetical protein
MDDAGANDWERRLSELDPPEREVAHALLSGADAASCALREQNSTLDYITCTGDDAMATVKVRLPGERALWVKHLPLAWVPRVAAQGADIVEVSAPNEAPLGSALDSRRAPAGVGTAC